MTTMPSDLPDAINELWAVFDLAQRGEPPNRDMVLNRMPEFMGPIVHALASATNSSIVLESRGMIGERQAIAMCITDPKTAPFTNSEEGRARRNALTEWYVQNQATGPSDSLPVFNPGKIRRLFPRNILDNIDSSAGKRVKSLRALFELALQYETYGPPHNGYGILNEGYMLKYGFPVELPTRDIITDKSAMYSWTLRALHYDVFRIDIDHLDRASPPFIMHWVASEPFLHTPTNVQMGGPGGVGLGCWVILRLSVTAWTVENSKRSYATEGEYFTLPQIYAYMERASTSLMSQITTSISRLELNYRDRVVEDPHQITVFSPRPIEYPERIHSAYIPRIGNPDVLPSSQVPSTVRNPGQSSQTEDKLIRPGESCQWDVNESDTERPAHVSIVQGQVDLDGDGDITMSANTTTAERQSTASAQGSVKRVEAKKKHVSVASSSHTPDIVPTSKGSIKPSPSEKSTKSKRGPKRTFMATSPTVFQQPSSRNSPRRKRVRSTTGNSASSDSSGRVYKRPGKSGGSSRRIISEEVIERETPPGAQGHDDGAPETNQPGEEGEYEDEDDPNAVEDDEVEGDTLAPNWINDSTVQEPVEPLPKKGEGPSSTNAPVDPSFAAPPARSGLLARLQDMGFSNPQMASTPAMSDTSGVKTRARQLKIKAAQPEPAPAFAIGGNLPILQGRDRGGDTKGKGKTTKSQIF
ncbi:unnamed protein product [Rhizoctonia solani]|uniref:Uncharacterized protein n=1 Tax=Rhizoctonia solani TaxID=456999 RepID=A0A8H2XQS8_9AGAM|nr:unnamed protein product [Rhizoctonia solani]